ncbi:MAG: transposase [Bacteroidia bacterium]
MSKPRKRYSKTEKLEIIKMSLEEDVSVPELSERFGLGPSTIYNWRSRYYKDHGIIPEGQGVKPLSDEEREVVRLKKQLRETELERDILKKAIGIFSKTDKKFSGS